MRWSMYLVKEEISRITFFNAEKQLLAVQIYLVISTGQLACVTTPLATLPSNNRFRLFFLSFL